MRNNEIPLPYSQEAEQSVLGAIILDSLCLNNIIDILPNSNFFYESINKFIYDNILEMYSSGEKIDLITVLNKISEKDSTKKIEMKNYLFDLVKIVPSISRTVIYAKIIREKYEIRSLSILANQILNESSKNENVDNLLEFTEKKLFEIRSGKISQSFTKIQDALLETFERLDKLRKKSQTDILGIPCGFRDLDEIITGLNKSDLILLAARPGMGKTSFALSIAKNVSLKFKTVIFSLEMSKEQLASRLLSIEGNIPGNKLRSGNLEYEWLKLTEASEQLSDLDLYIDDTAGITVQEMKAKIRRLGDVKLVVIDYLQLISTSKKVSNRVQEISEITRQLKIMAKDLDIPIICLSQLSRASEQRTDHRPVLSDLRDSGSIEQDADIVMMLYRPGYYSNNLSEKIDQSECECIVAKNRYGETRTVKLYWRADCTKFSSLDFSEQT